MLWSNSVARSKSAARVFFEALSTLSLSVWPVSLSLTRYFSPRQVPSSFWNSGACITSLSCAESLRSISAFQAWMVRSTSPEITLPGWASIAERTSASMNSLLRAFCASSFGLVVARTWSSRLNEDSVAAAADPAAPWLSVSAMT